MSYPILVEKLKPGQAERVVCEDCHAEFDWNPEDGDPYDCCVKHKGCGGQVVFKFHPGEKCKGCGKLDYSMRVDGCCSRRCVLQAEYAAKLAERAA